MLLRRGYLGLLLLAQVGQGQGAVGRGQGAGGKGHGMPSMDVRVMGFTCARVAWDAEQQAAQARLPLHGQ